MTPKTSLLTALRSFRPRENHDPLENFVTEAFAWLLINYPRFGGFYLEKILGRLGLNEISAGQPVEWTTRVNLGGVYPDLVGVGGGKAYLFEHKAWSHLHANQLTNYREKASREYGEQNFRLILVVGGRHLIDQDPDLAICWHEIHGWIAEWRNHRDYQPEHLFGDFQRLLETEGMGPPAPVSHESILAYKAAQPFEGSLVALVQRAFHHPWCELLKPIEAKPQLPWHRGLPGGQDPWGRFGIQLLGDDTKSSLRLFLGFLVNPTAHRVEWASPLCPDFGVIVGVNFTMHPNYDQLEEFARLRGALLSLTTHPCPDYQFLDHLAKSSEPNRWHPFHMRKPMIELLRGTQSADEQYSRFISEASRLVRAIAGCPEFREFREALQNEHLGLGQP